MAETPARRGRPFAVRLTGAERQIIEDAASKIGLGPGQFMRMVAIERARDLRNDALRRGVARSGE